MKVWWVGTARRHVYSNTKAAAMRSIQKQRQQGQIHIYSSTILCCGGVSSLQCHFTPNGACAGIPRMENLPLFWALRTRLYSMAQHRAIRLVKTAQKPLCLLSFLRNDEVDEGVVGSSGLETCVGVLLFCAFEVFRARGPVNRGGFCSLLFS